MKRVLKGINTYLDLFYGLISIFVLKHWVKLIIVSIILAIAFRSFDLIQGIAVWTLAITIAWIVIVMVTEDGSRKEFQKVILTYLSVVAFICLLGFIIFAIFQAIQ